MKSLIFAAAILLTTTFAIIGCGVENGTCVAGEQCECTGAGACHKECLGGGCDFEIGALSAGAAGFDFADRGCTLAAQGNGSVEFSCIGGSCTADNHGRGQMILSCPGGNCEMACHGIGDCRITDCKQGCKVSCGGTGTCINECKDPSCK